MKKLIVVMISSVLLIAACGKKSGTPRYAKGSKEYSFFAELSKSVPVLNPDKSNELIYTSKFSIRTAEVMPALYRALGRYASNLQNLPSDRLKGFVHKVARDEAQKKLLLLAATEKQVSVSEDSVKEQLERYYSRSGGKEAFVNNINAQGLTLDFVKEDLKNSLIIQKYLDDVVFGKIVVTPEEVKEAYKQDKLATVRHILFLTRGKSKSEKEKIRKKAEEILARARKGEDFAKLAREYSDDPGSRNNGGLYKDFARGQMVKPFENAAFNLPVGSISDLVKTRYGYHIIKVIKRTKETRPFKQVEGELYQQLTKIKKQDAIVTLLDSLKSKYQYRELFKS